MLYSRAPIIRGSIIRVFWPVFYLSFTLEAM